MKKLKVEQISLYNLLLFFTILFLCNCKEKSKSQKNEGEKLNLPTEIPLTKEDFFNCSKAKDTVFANGDYIKFIPVESEHYSVEININGMIDTLDYYFNCQTYSGMIPKLFFRLNSNYICIGQESSSYRYLTVCNFNNKERSKKVDVSKFETAIDISSANDGFIFKIKDTVFFYNRNKSILLFKKLPNGIAKFRIKESTLNENKVNIVYEDGNSVTYKLKDFQFYSVKDMVL